MLNNQLVLKYEAGGNPATVSTGSGDLGGKSYGRYQFSSEAGVVENFVEWLCNYPEACYANYGRVLKNAYPVNSNEFINEWKSIGTIDAEGFGKLQDEYAGDMYYNAGYFNLLNGGYDITKHNEAMKAVLFSRAIQYGPANMCELWTEAVRLMGHPEISWVDDKCFDREMIECIYNFLIQECDNAYLTSKGTYHSPKDWANGSYDVVKIGLRNRFINEKVDALKLLEDEGFEKNKNIKSSKALPIKDF